MDLPTLLQQVIVTVITLPISGYLAKKFLEYGFDRRLASYKADLEHQSKAEIARLKSEGASELAYLRSELSLFSKEREVEYAWLHAERAKVIDEIYKLLVEADWAAQTFSNAAQYAGVSRQQQYREANDAFVAFYRKLDKSRIYLPVDFANKLEKFNDESRKVLNELGVFTLNPRMGEGPDGGAKEFEAWMRAEEYFRKFFVTVRRSLEQDVRMMMGARHAS